MRYMGVHRDVQGLLAKGLGLRLSGWVQVLGFSSSGFRVFGFSV